MQINGSTILVTGASGGLGTAIARDLKAKGASLILSARNVELLDSLAAELDAEVVVADLTDRADVERLAATAATCDVLVANAGIGNDPKLEELTEADIDFSIDVNLRAPIVLAQAFAKAKITAGKPGQVVLVGSLAGIAATAGTRMYNATKFGLRGFSLSFSQELDGTGVGCTLVSPGFIRDAGMFHENDIELPSGVRTKSPQDVADGVAKAIEKNPLEVYVSPTELRAVSTFSSLAPSASAFVQKKLGLADRV